MRILVPVDGSPASLRALKLAIEQVKAQATNGVLVINMQNLATAGLSEGAGIMSHSWIKREEEREGCEILKEPQTICEQAGISHAIRIECGGIATTIEKVARQEEIDHIVMGTRGLGGIRGLLVGSVATQVFHIVDIPVTLVK